MIYRSNLTAPDLSPNFKLLVKPRPWSLGHSIPSDPDYEPECCFMSHDEAAILYHCAQATRRNVPSGALYDSKCWLDIGTRFGWTAATIASSANNVTLVDQELSMIYAQDRMERNLRADECWDWVTEVIGKPATVALAQLNANAKQFDGFCIDANHDDPEPLNDAKGCLKIAAPDCCMVFHDFRGRPIRDAVRFLMAEGFKARVYWTPAMMAVCWRGNFKPPVHHRDPAVDWNMVRIAAEIDRDFDLSRTE